MEGKAVVLIDLEVFLTRGRLERNPYNLPRPPPSVSVIAEQAHSGGLPTPIMRIHSASILPSAHLPFHASLFFPVCLLQRNLIPGNQAISLDG